MALFQTTHVRKPASQTPNGSNSIGLPRSWKWLPSLLSFSDAKDLMLLAPACVLAIFSGVAEPAMSIFFARFFDAFAQLESRAIDDDEFTSRTKASILILVGISAAILLLKGTYLCLWVVFGELQAKAARNALFQSLLRKDEAWYEASESGINAQLVQMQIYIRELQLSSSQPLGFVLDRSVQCIASLAVALYYCWRLALLIFAAILLTTLFLSVISMELAEAVQSQHAEMARASRTVNHVVRNITTVKCSNAQKQERLSYCSSISRASTFYRKQARINAVRIGFTGCTITLILVTALYYATVLIHERKTNASAAMTTFFCCMMAAQGFQTVLPNLIVLEKGRNAASALSKILDDAQDKSTVSNTRGKFAPPSVLGDIAFTNVSFAYSATPEHFILWKASFHFEAGKTTFIVGRSGSGKSTVINLIHNQYDVNDGYITIDGIDVKRLNRDWLRNNITILPQDSKLFSETVFRNVAFGWRGSSKMTTQAVQNSLEFAEVADHILNLPQGLLTVLGSEGFTISGGQRQRLVLARTFLRDAPILILDEPTSSLDPRLRRSIMTNLRRWRKGKTTIIITHDLAHIDPKDNVYTLDDSGTIFKDTHPTKTYPKPHDFQLTPRLQLDTTSSHHSGQQHHSEHVSAAIRSASQIPPMRQNLRKGATGLPYGYRRLSQALILHTDVGTSWYRSSIRKASLNNSLVSSELVKELIADDLTTELPAYKIRRLSAPQAQYGLLPSPHQVSTQTHALRTVLKTVWPHLESRYRACLLCGCFSSILYAACPSAFAYLVVQNFNNWLLRETWQQRARTLVFSGIALSCVDGAFAFLMHYLFEQAGQTWCDALRIKSFAHIVEQPKAWFDVEQISPAHISFTLNRNAEELRNLVGRHLPLVMVALIMMSVAIIWSFVVCWKITIVALALMPFLYGITKVFQHTSEHWEARTNQIGEDVNSIFDEVFSDINTVRNLTLEQHFHRKSLLATKKALGIGIKRGCAIGLCFGLSESGMYFITAAIFAYGTVLAKSREFSISSVLQSLALLLFSTSNANSIIGFIPQISSSLDTGLKLLKFMELPTTSHENGGIVALSHISAQALNQPAIFNNVTFRYPSRVETVALSSFDLVLEPGQLTAIVGTSGSGKSTVASLLLKLYNVSPQLSTATSNPKPVLSVFGHDMRNLDASVVHRLIGIVPQNPVIVPGTIRDNILYGELGPGLCNDRNMVQAARASGIHDFIRILPDGYDTGLGPGDLSLSGGQAQRIVIARALARHPRILILDEATSSLDGESADDIRRTIIQLVKNRHGSTVGNVYNTMATMTVVAITHDVEMMAAADRLVVIKDGTFGEDGTYKELLERKGALWQLLNNVSCDQQDL